MQARVVKVGLTLRDGETQLFAVPMICKPFASQPTTCRIWQTPMDVQRLEVDILIGSDQYWNLITSETRRGTSGSVAINTRLGWVLSAQERLVLSHTPS